LSLLNIRTDDVTSLKMMMLIEGTFGKGVKHSVEKNMSTPNSGITRY